MSVIDLYSILKEYAQKLKSAHIEKMHFINMLIVTAKYKARKHSAWRMWTIRPREKFQFELDSLVEKNLVNIESNGKNEFIVVPAYYTEAVRELWAKVDSNIEMPFPDGSEQQDSIPAHIIKHVDFETEFKNLIAAPPEEDIPVIKLIFPDNCGSILILSSIISTYLLDTAINKIKYYLSKDNNKISIYNKLLPIVPNYTAQADAVINDILMNTVDCKGKIKSAETAIFSIWVSLCKLIHESLMEERSNLSLLEISVIQSIYIINVFNLYYRDHAVENDESFKLNQILDDYFNKSPYIYTIKKITEFRDSNSVVLKDRFPRDILISTLKKKTSVSVNSSRLPEIISFVDAENEKWYVNKTKLYHAFEFIRIENRQAILKAVQTRWFDVIKEYHLEPAMRNDDEFESLVLKTANSEIPVLAALYIDTKFIVVKGEISFDDTDAAVVNKFFADSIRLPLRIILGLSRHEIIKKIQSALPFWYSIPFIVALIRFFKQI